MFTTVVQFFEACNLNCKFCYQKRSKIKDISKHDLEIFASKLQDSIKTKYVLDNDYMFRIMGGELFMDGLSDWFFDYYKNFIDIIRSTIYNRFPDSKVHIDFYTNGIFTKRERVLKLIKTTNASLHFSFDEIDRFKTEKQKQLCIDNMKWFRDNGSRLGYTSIIIKSDIDTLLEKESFKTVYDLSTAVDFRDCYPDMYNVELETLISFYKKCIDIRLFKIFNIDILLSNIIQSTDRRNIVGKYCHGVDRFVYFINGVEFWGCKHFRDVNNISKIDSTSTKQVMFNTTKKYGCLWCEHDPYCPKPCWCGVYTLSKECEFKQLFDYIKSNPEIIEDYKAFIKENNVTIQY